MLAICRLPYFTWQACTRPSLPAAAPFGSPPLPSAPAPPLAVLQDRVSKPQTLSPFLEQFYKAN